MAIASNFPAIKPSLSLDFANTKRLDSRVTFTRTTTATYYDGVTTAKAEENLFVQSQTFDVSGWTLARASITANTSVAPDGTTTAETLTADGTSGTHLIQSDDSLTPAGQTRTMSVFAKAGTNNFIQLAFGADAAPYANFDLSGGTVGNSASVTASIVSVGSGWYRCIVTATSSTATGARFFIITNGTSVRGESNSLNTTVLIWGAQMEYRSSVSSYTATTTQPITNYIPVLLTAASGVARFQHNPTTDESLGLLIEEQRTNLALYSADFTNAVYGTVNASITSNTIVAPDGTLTGDKIIGDTTNGAHLVRQVVSYSATTTYTATIYAKAAEQTFLRFICQISGVGDVNLYVNLTDGSITTTNNTWTVVSTSATLVGNNWYRCSITFTTGATGGLGYLSVGGTTASGTPTYTGNGYAGIYIWGAQLEAGAFPTSYIATTAATVTRNADAASMTGSNFTSWYNAAEGTVYFESQTAQGTDSYPYSLFGSSTTNRISATYSTNARMNSSIRVNGVFEANTSTPNDSAPTLTFGKGATAYKFNDFGFSWNGAAALTDTSTTLPTVLNFFIGNNNQTSGNWLNGTIKKLAYYPLRVTNAQLQALTS